MEDPARPFMQLLNVGPRFAMNATMMCNLKSLGLAIEFRDIDVLSRAVRYRHIASTPMLLETHDDLQSIT